MATKGPDPQQRPSRHYATFIEGLPSMEGRAVVVTGASRGLGFVTAKALAEKSALVFMMSRRSPRAMEALANIALVAAGPAPQFVECDQLSFEGVRSAAAELQQRVSDGIDILCLNAGIMFQPDEPSKDGYDITICTNVLSHFLLAKELLPQLEEAALKRGEARIVSMSSGSAFGKPPFDAKFFEQSGGRLGGQEHSYLRYHQSKLANLLFTSELAKRLRSKESTVMALACTPGVCATDMYVHAMSFFQPGKPANLSAVPSVEDGCLAQLKCICDQSVQSGELYGPDHDSGLPIRIAMAPPAILVDDATAAELWGLCELAVGSFDV